MAVLLDFAVEDKSEGDGGSQHQQDCVNQRGNAEGARAAYSFVEILNVGAERSKNQRTCNVDSPGYPMEFRKTLAQAIGKLQRTQQKGAGAGQSVGQQIPSERMIVPPDGVRPVNQETLVVAKNVSHHQADETKKQIFRPYSGRFWN